MTDLMIAPGREQALEALASDNDHLVEPTFNGGDEEQTIVALQSTRSSAQRVITTAAREVGYREGANNNTKFGRWYGMNHQPWCAMFVSWVAAHAGAASLIPRHAYTPSGAAWFKKRGQWHKSPKPGDIVYFRWPTSNRICHVGIVEKVSSDGSFQTIEGNWQQAVCRVRRTTKYAVGFGRPKYGSTSSTSPGTQRLSEDGQLGPRTVEALQARLGVTQDGWFLMVNTYLPDFGPNTNRALQNHLNRHGAALAVDGQLGPQSVTALQRRLNDLDAGPDLVTDGRWGSKTTLLLQKVLNRNTF